MFLCQSTIIESLHTKFKVIIETVSYLACIVSKSSIVAQLYKRLFMISSKVTFTGLPSNTHHTYNTTGENETTLVYMSFYTRTQSLPSIQHQRYA